MSNLAEAQINLFAPENSDAVSFRPIHYLGSKMRLVREIQLAAKRANPFAASICDAFSGSATVAYAMSKQYVVTPIDIQEYARVLSSALVGSYRPTLAETSAFLNELLTGQEYAELQRVFSPAIQFEIAALKACAAGRPEDVVEILESGSIKFSSSLNLSYVVEVREKIFEHGLHESPKINIANVYGGVYFSYAQAVVIDGIRNSIDHLESSESRDFFLAALISTVSECVNTIGKQFAQPIRILSKDGNVKKNLISKVVTDRGRDIHTEYRKWVAKYLSMPVSEMGGTARRGDVTETLNKLADSGTNFDLIYADPPYTRDHYSRYYHVLETLALRDVPEVSVTNLNGKTEVSRGLYRKERHQSPFCVKSQAPQAFESLFAAARRFSCPLLLSYSPYSKANDDHPRMMEVSKIVELGLRFYSKHELLYLSQFTHSKLNSQENNKERVTEAEVLVTFFP